MLNDYFTLEAKLIDDFKSHILHNKVRTKTSELGSIVGVSGNLFDHLLLYVQFPTEQKKYSAEIALNNGYLKFETSDLLTLYKKYRESHRNLTSQYEQMKWDMRQEEVRHSQEEIAKLKAEESYQRAKERAFQKFEEYTYRTLDSDSQSREFFYTLGWLAKHIGSVSATIPDYLDPAFKKYFGEDVKHRVVDSKKRTSNGFPMQYSWSFKATLPGVECLPEELMLHLNPDKTQITDTAFIWDLIDTYNFKFGRKQNVNSILSAIPLSHHKVFYEGYES